jgi:hypothetical protein
MSPNGMSPNGMNLNGMNLNGMNLNGMSPNGMDNKSLQQIISNPQVQDMAGKLGIDTTNPKASMQKMMNDPKAMKDVACNLSL